MTWRKNKLKVLLLMSLIITVSTFAKADNGYRLWMKYDKIDNTAYIQHCQNLIKALDVSGYSKTIRAAQEELKKGLDGLLNTRLPLIHKGKPFAGTILAGTPATLPILKNKEWQQAFSKLAKGGYIIQKFKVDNGFCILIASNEDIGVLYGVFRFLRLVQTQSSLKDINISSSPKLQWRMLNHWDKLDGSVERGYAGNSLWKWNELPGRIDPRYRDYARANASIGINAVVLNNVNANPQILTTEYLKKVAALADVFRPYGIRVLLSANFASPKVLGDLNTADPLNPQVREWWKNKTDEIYTLIPDFGGFLVKANSEGQPGPQDYHRTHADGANMMAAALAPHNGILIWRAFVYKSKSRDRAKEAFNEFAPLDGSFLPNVFLQIKNGPLDFQPREPFSPLFGAMPKTPEMMEFQITQEYLGHNKALVYLAPLFKETLESDTYAKGKGSTVARVIDGRLQSQKITGMAGVANTGNDSDWTGYIFGQANWYAYGRLAWNHELSAKEIACEWIKMTLTQDTVAIKTILKMMMSSWETLVNYQTPLGLNVLSDANHYWPAPASRTYYTHADSSGIGFDRTAKGSNAVAQYFPEVRNVFADIQTCPEKFICWFHHVPWNYKTKSGRSFWQELCYKYNNGVMGVRIMREEWASLKEAIDPSIFNKVSDLLAVQEHSAIRWRDTCLEYFGTLSQLPILYK